MKIFYRELLTLFLLLSCTPLYGQKNKDKGVIESESPVYESLGIDQVLIHVSVKDAETGEMLAFELQAKDTSTNGVICKIDSSAQPNIHNIELPIKGVYCLSISAHAYIDTVLTLDLQEIESYEIDKEFLLYPKRTDVEITIRDIDKDEFLSMDVMVRNRVRNEQIELHPEDAQDYIYIVKLREEDEYEVEVKNPEGLIFYTNNIIDPKKDKKLEVQVLTQLKPNTKVQLYGITFATRSAELNENSKLELDRVAVLLKAYPTAVLEVAAHTDSLGTMAFNMELSRKRADVVYRYLVAKGVSGTNLIRKGYGPTKPIDSNKTEPGRARNRRFELIVRSL